MKKNKFLKLASGLLVLCLLTTCVISTTFAKYVTSGDANDTARVAKWGVEIGVQAGTDDWGFEKQYDNGATPAVITVKADQKVVAPGTKGDLAYFSITGTPEVSVRLDVVVSNTTDDNAAVDVVVKKEGTNYLDWTTGNVTNDTFTLSEDYYPVVYTLSHKAVSASDYAPIATGNLAAIESALEALTANYQVSDLSAWNTLLGDYKIEWEWAFEVNDKADTLLGNIIAEVDDTAYGANVSTGISFELAITATQIN